jgi:hypothetical protein
LRASEAANAPQVLPLLLLILGLGMLKAFPLPEPPALWLAPSQVHSSPPVVPVVCPGGSSAAAWCALVRENVPGAVPVPASSANNSCEDEVAPEDIAFGDVRLPVGRLQGGDMRS